MNGQRLAVEEVRGSTDDLQIVDESPSCLLRFEVDGEDSARQRAELCFREFVEGIVVETRIVHTLDFWKLLALAGEP